MKTARFSYGIIVSALAALLALWISFVIPSVSASPLSDVTPVSMNCPFGGGGDQTTRGFYITDFPGDHLDTVTLRYYPLGAPAGNSVMNLVARLNTYDGPIVGTASVTADFTVTQTVTFDFGGADVPLGSTITFLNIPGGFSAPQDNYLFYDTGSGPCPGFTETNGTTPPLDSFRRDSIGGTITGHLGLASGECVSIPAGSVVGAMAAATQADYAPGQAANGVIINAGTYWVIGQDATHQYYKILLGCQFLWVPINAMGPSHQAPWSGQALPTGVVS